MANPYTTLVNSLNSAITTGFSGYTGIVVTTRRFDAANLPEFTRYCIVISPPDSDAWSERTIAVRQFQYILTVDLYLLVKNFDDVNSLFGVTAPDRGIFEMINDIKTLLRSSNLTGSLDKSYEELSGPSAIEYAAAQGADSGEHAFVRRAKLKYVAKLPSFCVAITP